MTTIYDGPVDGLSDHSAAIDERAAQGDYGDAADEEAFDLEDLDEFADEDELFDVGDIEDMQAFLEQNPGLIDATRKLKTLSVIEPPTLPESAAYPRRIYSLATLLVACLLVYAVARLVLATIREHQD